MKDIDFEELDRAVSSLIGNASDDKKTTTPSVDPEEPAGEKTAVAVETEEKPTAVAVHTPEASHQTEDALVHASPLISSGKKPGGRFMDVVHPTTSVKPDSPVPSKTGKVLHPISDTIKPHEEPKETKKDEEDKAPHTDKPTHTEPTEHKPEPDAEPDTHAEEPKWPDPLDVLNKPEDAKADDPEESDHHEIAPDAPDPLDAQQSPSAPFLPDTKVEKRPLGAFSDESDSQEDIKDADDAGQPPAAAASLDSQMPAIAQKLPPELEGDIVNVEVSEATGPATEPEPTADESQNLEDHVNEQLSDDDSKDKPESHDDAGSAAVLSHTMSIPKQYHAAHDTPDTAEHPVFDTKEYHPPIDAHAEHAGKHTFVWIAAAVILLAGTAVAFGYWVLNGL